MPLRSIYVVTNGHDFILFYGWRIFRCINTPYFLYSFIHQRTSQLFPCVGYYLKNDAMSIGCRYRLEIVILVSLDIYPEKELLDQMVDMVLFFWGSSILFSIAAIPIHIPTNSKQSFLFSISSPLVISSLFNHSQSDNMKYIIEVLICISLIIFKDGEYFFKYLLVLCMSSLEKCLSSYSFTI